jgi:hypothetical protein
VKINSSANLISFRAPSGHHQLVVDRSISECSEHHQIGVQRIFYESIQRILSSIYSDIKRLGSPATECSECHLKIFRAHSTGFP